MFDNDVFTVLKIVAKVMEFITKYIPWWVFLVGGLLVAIFVPLIV